MLLISLLVFGGRNLNIEFVAKHIWNRIYIWKKEDKSNRKGINAFANEIRDKQPVSFSNENQQQAKNAYTGRVRGRERERYFDHYNFKKQQKHLHLHSASAVACVWQL